MTPGDDARKGSGEGRFLLRAVVPVRWRDLDAFGHVNNSTFLTYVEETRLAWFSGLGDVWMNETIAPLLAATHFNFRRPIQWPETLAIELRVERIGTRSLTLAHRMSAHDDATRLYADGNSVLVWIDRASGRPVTVPAAICAACAVLA